MKRAFSLLLALALLLTLAACGREEAPTEELPGEDLYQELLAEDRAREEAQAAEAAAKVAAAQAAAGVLDEDADAAGAVEADSVEE